MEFFKSADDLFLDCQYLRFFELTLYFYGAPQRGGARQRKKSWFSLVH